VGIINLHNINYSLSLKSDCYTYPPSPYNENYNILYDSFELLLSGLKKYISSSYCDFIQPQYEIPLMIHSKEYSLSDFYPIQFIDENISSDEGLYQILQFLSSKKLSDNYQIILVDVGIFWRYYKWIYNPIIRIPGSQTACVMLGFWHTYKELCQLIYQKSISYLFGPVIGKLISNASLLWKPKLGILETYMNWMMLAYNSIFPILSDAITQSRGEKRNILKNIKFIFDSAIPFVSFYKFLLMVIRLNLINL